LFGRAVIHIVL